MSRPIVLSPATPSELLAYIIAHQRYPTTILICWPRPVFLAALVEDVKHGLSLADTDDNSHPQLHAESPSRSHNLLYASALQKAVSRHIRLAFIPTLAHLRAYLTAFSPLDSKVSAPPNLSSPLYHSHTDTLNHQPPGVNPPLLLIYGLLELHRDGADWSAQGIGLTAATLVEAAARAFFRPAIIEPRGSMGFNSLDEFIDEEVPLLSGAHSVVRRGKAPLRRRSVSIRGVLSRWFEFDIIEVEGEGIREPTLGG